MNFRNEEINPAVSYMDRPLNDGVLAKKLVIRKTPSPFNPLLVVTEESPHPVLKGVAYTPFDKLTTSSRGLFDAVVFGENINGMALPAGIHHMRGLNFKKED